MLSTVEPGGIKCYKVSEQSRFWIYIHSLKSYDAGEVLNTMRYKISHNESFSKKELLMIGLLCFMKSDKSIDNCLYDSAVTITNIKDLDEDISQFVKGIILMLCDKFVDDELKSIAITIVYY